MKEYELKLLPFSIKKNIMKINKGCSNKHEIGAEIFVQKTEKENMEEIDTKICLKKTNKN